MKLKICVVVDDSSAEVADGLRERVESCFMKMVLQGVNTFVFYDLSKFSILCLNVLTDLKKR